MFLLDALDECDSESQRLFLRHLNRTSGHFKEARIFITSRPHSSIQELLSHFPNRNIASYEAAQRDVDIFIAGKVSELAVRKQYTAKLRSQVLQALTAKAEGTFLWVGLACKELDEVNAKDCLQVLNRLPSGLDRLYSDLLARAIEKAGTESKELIQILKFVSVALSPITLGDVSVACRLYEQEEADERELFTQNLVDACRFMVVVIDDRYVRLLHKSVRDFLFRSAVEHFPSEFQAEAEIASRCVERLLENHETHIKLRNSATFPDTTFVNYATRHWPDHANLAADYFRVLPHQESFFNFISESREHWLTEALLDGLTIEGAFSIFHVVAAWNLLSVLDYIKVGNCLRDRDLRLCHCLEEFKRFGGNPLIIAAATKHVEVLEAFLDLTMIEVDNQVMLRSSTNGRNLQTVQTQGYWFPITRNVIMAAAENHESGVAMMNTLLTHRNMLPIDEELIEHLIEHTYISKEVFVMLLNKVKDEPESLSFTRDTYTLNRDDGDAAANDFSANSRSTPRLSPSLVESVIRRFDRSVVDSILDAFEFPNAVTMESLLEAAVENQFHGSDVMRAVLTHSKVDLVASYAAVKISLEHFDADLVRKLIAMADIEIDQCLLISATGNQVYEVVSVVLQFNPQIPINEHVLKSAAHNSKHGRTIIAELLSHVGIGALSLSVEAIRFVIQKDCFTLQLLNCLRDVSIVISALHEWIEGAFVAKDSSYYFLDFVHLDDNTVRTRGRELLRMLLEQHDRGIVVTAELLQVARKTAMPQEILEKSFRSELNQILYTPELFAEAASWLGRSAMQALSENCDNVPVAGIEQALIAVKDSDRIERISHVQNPANWHPDNGIVLAIQHNDNNTLQTLLRQTAQATTRKKYEEFVLTAVNRNNVVALRSLLSIQKELNLSTNDHGRALFQAVIRGRAGAVQVFLDYGVSANSRSKYHNMPVLCAAVLVALRVDTDASGATNSSDNTQEEILRLLLEAGADVNARNEQSSTALQIAVSLGNLRFVKLLLVAGADVNAPGGLYGNVLIDAVSSDVDNSETVRILIEHGATFHTATDGLDVLHAAIRKHKDRTIHFLLSHWTWPRHEYRNFLLLQHTEYRKSTVCLLLRHGAEVDGADHEGQTCVHRAVTHWAYSRDAVWFTNVLLDAGAQVNRCTSNGQTPLHWVSHYFGTSGIVTYLLDYGARIELMDQYGCTALQVALYAENLEIAQLLLERGARTDIPDLYGITATHLLDSDPSSLALSSTDSDKSNQKDRVVALMHVLRHVNSIKIAEKANMSVRTSWIWGRLALWLFRIGKLEEAITALEQPISPGFSDPEQPVSIECDRYDRGELKGIRYKCGVCDDCDLCDKCWMEQDNIVQPPCCADHKAYFIHAPGSSWKDHPAGVVNDRKETIKEWLARLENMCCRELEKLTQKDRQSERQKRNGSEAEQCSDSPTTQDLTSQDHLMCGETLKNATGLREPSMGSDRKRKILL